MAFQYGGMRFLVDMALFYIACGSEMDSCQSTEFPQFDNELEPESSAAVSLIQTYLTAYKDGSITSSDKQLLPVPASTPAGLAATKPAVTDDTTVATAPAPAPCIWCAHGSASASSSFVKRLPGSACWAARASWVKDMVHADPDGDDRVILDVGCNTGTDAVKWFQRWDKNAKVAEQWSHAVLNALKNTNAKHPNGACGYYYSALYASTNDYYYTPPEENLIHGLTTAVSNPSQEGPKVICVEPLPSTVNMLRNLKAKFFGSSTNFEVVQAAVSDQAGHVNFTYDKDAQEDARIITGGPSNGHVVSVPQVTVDQLLAERGLKSVDVLTIDTEGHDPSVIKGAQKALQNGMVRVLIFEIHQDFENTPWATTSLYSVLQMLDSWQYDCYLTDNYGPLHLLTGVWNATMESMHTPIGWSNVACVKKSDIWQSIFQKYDIGLFRQ